MSHGITRRQALTGIAAAALASGSGRARAHEQADGPGAPYPLPGTVGLVRGQVARLSIVHHEHGDISIPPICNIVASILGADGSPLVTEKFANLGPNEARFLDFPHPGGKGARRGTRMEIIDLVRFTPGHPIGTSLQIIDQATGATDLATIIPCIVPDPEVGGEPGPFVEPGLPLPGTVGLVRGQGLRLSLTHHDHESLQLPPICQFVAEVFDATGRRVASETFRDLKGHESVFLDVPHPGGKGPRRDGRVEWMLSVRHTPGHPCGATGQVVDLSSGKTLGAFVPCISPDPSL